MDISKLYRLLDAARIVLSILVGAAAEILNANDILHLPAGVTGVLVGFIALATHYGIRARTTPAPAVDVGRRSIDDDVEADRLASVVPE